MDGFYFILLVFVLSCIIHLIFIYFLFTVSRIESVPSNRQEKNHVKLTILICARNEALNLEKNIPLICEQSYPNLEVLVVNHKSTDNSLELLTDQSEQYEMLSVMTWDQDDTLLPGKRSAIYAGLVEASGEYILMTDADCQPTSDQWAALMVDQAISNQADVVLGIGAYESDKSFLNKFIQFETFQTATLYLSAAANHWPYMGVGRNLLVKKDVLKKRLKQSVVPGVLSGDDDLLIANLTNSHRIVCETSEYARTVSIAKKTWSTYIKQKMRHMSTAEYYRDQHRWILQLFHGSQALVLFTFIILLFSSYYLTVILMMTCRYALVMLNLKRQRDKLNMKSNLLFYPIMELISLSVPIVSMVGNRISVSNEWN